MSQRVSPVKKLLSSARAMRIGMNMWPPFLFTGVHIMHISPDYREALVKLRKTPFTTNYFGVQYGGSMFSMVDPFWALLVYRNLGDEYVVWDRRGEIDFETPGRTALFARVHLTEEVLEEIRTKAAGGDRVLQWFDLDLLDRERNVVAKVRKQLHIRRKK